MKYQIQLIRNKDDKTVLDRSETFTKAKQALSKWKKTYPDYEVKIVSLNSYQWIKVLDGHGNLV